MKKGASLYYASDKNVYDALNQSKVDNSTLQTLFIRRNIVCSKLTKREDLAEFFSRLTHDLLDHRDLSDKLGIVPRRERITAVDLAGAAPRKDALQRAIEEVRSLLTSRGDVVQTHTEGTTIRVGVRYSVIDYKRSEFSQVQDRSGFVELIQENGRMVIRSTKSEYMDDIRDELIKNIEAETDHPLDRKEVTLFHHTSPATRSQFFYDLISDLHNHTRRDVTDVFVYKPRPLRAPEAEGDDLEEDPHIERIILRGVGVSQTDLLRDLTSEKSYYIAKVGWIAVANMGTGSAYELEATFSDPKDCTGFSYILRGVYDLGENGKLSKFRRAPVATEIDSMARIIENKARELLKGLDLGE